MAVQFVSASTQYLENTAPLITAVPFTVGMWVSPGQTAAIQTFWSLGNAVNNTNYFDVSYDGSSFDAVVNGTGIAIASATITVGAWYYVVARFISATSRGLAVLNQNGTVVSASDSTSATPTGLTRGGIGFRNVSPQTRFLDGAIAEYFLANIDIQGDGGALATSTLYQLAYNGPFSIPSIYDHIVEYRSFQSDLGGNQDMATNVYWGSVQQIWTNNNGATLVSSPSFLSSTYARPWQNKRSLMV
jgi:hypothetical protein